MTVTAPIVRNLTADESSAIASVVVDENTVIISYQSNPANEYTYQATDEFVTSLRQILEADDLMGLSLGGVISDARRVQDLIEATV